MPNPELTKKFEKMIWWSDFLRGIGLQFCVGVLDNELTSNFVESLVIKCRTELFSMMAVDDENALLAIYKIVCPICGYHYLEPDEEYNQERFGPDWNSSSHQPYLSYECAGCEEAGPIQYFEEKGKDGQED